MADQWYVKKGGKKHGPFSTDQLKKLAKGKSKLLVWIERQGEFYFVNLRKG